MPNCILWHNRDRDLSIIDIPRSIENAQGKDLIENGWRLLSVAALEAPFPSNEPRSVKAVKARPEAPIEELVVQKHLQLVLDQLRELATTTWHLPRRVAQAQAGPLPVAGAKRRLSRDEHDDTPSRLSEQLEHDTSIYSTEVFHNQKSVTEASQNVFGRGTTFIPPSSSFIYGDISSTTDLFSLAAPKFDCVILDPPWPNRSARRKQAYGLSESSHDIRRLLSMIPLRNKLSKDALVGIWLTNKPAFREMVLDWGGLFDEWDLEFVEEWIWLKVTKDGKPVCALESTWKKPYEVLLLARRKDQVSEDTEVKRRVMVGVPDIHSRKPNLVALLKPMLPARYVGLEVFARNLTAGWWSWGNEVLKFQHESQWTK